MNAVHLGDEVLTALGVANGTARAEYLVNEGGFTNASFTVRDGARILHVKLARPDAPRSAAVPGLARWMAFGDELAARHHAPAILQPIFLPTSGWHGAVFPHVAGTHPDLAADDTARREVWAILSRLHADAELAATIIPFDGTPTAAQFADAGLLDMLRQDWAETQASPTAPDFVSRRTWEWMAAEVRAVAAIIADSPAFAVPCESAIHADMWDKNVLRTDAGEWVLLDWDEFGIGDVAQEFAQVFWPRICADLAGITRGDWPAEFDEIWPGTSLAVRERVRLLGRLLLLVDVVDSLADWAEAGRTLADATAFRAAKRTTHETALHDYRAIFG